MIQEVQAKTALNKLKRKMPYAWDLNIYRGCTHGCQYCYALYSHQYLENQNFFKDVYVKTNIVELLEEQLSSRNWKREIVNIGNVCDSYQPIEKKYKIMPEVLKLMIKYKTPIVISTKSDLILRDFDLIDELSRITYVNIAATITTMDEKIRQKLEPGRVPSLDRFKMLKEFRKTNANTGLHFMPIVPYLNDTSENFEKLFKAEAEAEVDYMLLGTMYLRSQTRKHFFEFLAKDFPELIVKYNQIYPSKKIGVIQSYKEEMYKRLKPIQFKYGLSSHYSKPIKEKLKQEK